MSAPSLRKLAAGALCCTFFATAPLFALAEDNDRPRPPRNGEHRKPPQAAYDACADQEEDTACEVSFHSRTIEGTCKPDREDGTLFCRPSRPPGPPPESSGEQDQPS